MKPSLRVPSGIMPVVRQSCLENLKAVCCRVEAVTSEPDRTAHVTNSFPQHRTSLRGLGHAQDVFRLPDTAEPTWKNHVGNTGDSPFKTLRGRDRRRLV